MPVRKRALSCQGTKGECAPRRRHRHKDERQLLARREKEMAAKTMVGLCVRLSSRVQRQKEGVPSTPLVVTHVTRRGDRLCIHFSGRDAQGKPLLYKDRFDIHDEIGHRYEDATCVKNEPLQPELFEAFVKSSSESARSRARAEISCETAKDLRAVMPMFQFNASCSDRGLTSRRLASEGDLQCLLASECQIFHAEDDFGTGRIWRATCARGVLYDTAEDCVREKAFRMLQLRYRREEVLNRSSDMPAELTQVAGAPLHPWQAWLYAEFRLSKRDRGSAIGSELLATVHREGYGCVQGLAMLPFDLRVIVAEPGSGKTRLGALCAHGRPTMVVAVRATVRQWVREAGLVGVSAFQVGAGGKSVAQIRRAIAENKGQMWVATRGVALDMLRKKSLAQMPAPDLIIVDEFHVPLPKFNALVSAFPGVAVLGLTGTYHTDIATILARHLGWANEMLEAAVIRVPVQHQGTVFPLVAASVKYVRMSSLEMACYEGNKEWMTEKQRLRLLIFPVPNPHASSGYKVDLWSAIVRQLQEAEKDLFRHLSRLLNRVFDCDRRSVLLQKLTLELGEAAVDKIKAVSARLTDVSTPCGSLELDSTLCVAFERRKKILGGYSFLLHQLDAVTAGSEVDCPVCMDRTAKWCIAQCGHLVCETCAASPELQRRCPNCRAESPVWKNSRDVAALFAGGPAQTDDAQEHWGSAAALDTSSKLKTLAAFLLDLKPEERAVVICPDHLLTAVQSEMRRVGLELGLMAGSGVQQENTLTAWNRGKRSYKGLLCAPSILGVDLADATSVVFLTPIMSIDNFKQALARVVRQGHASVASGLPVKLRFLVSRGTEEDNQEHLNSLMEIVQTNSR